VSDGDHVFGGVFVSGSTPVVETVLGPVAVDELGVVLPHEHVFHDLYAQTVNSQLILSDRAVAAAELAYFVDNGGSTLVDQTVHGMNPDPEALREVAGEVVVNIVAGTGFYWERFHPPWLADMAEPDIADLMVSDLTKGIASTDIRAGIIGEIGTGHREISAAESRVLRACAAAQRETNAPISTHAVFTKIGLEQARMLEEAGANLDKVVIGHVDTMPDLAYHEQLLDMGVWIAYDTVGQTDKQSDETRADDLVELLARGHRDRILISSDIAKRGALRAYGGSGYQAVLTSFLPLLRQRGVSEYDIEALTIHNPRRLFAE
jgi:phosphotriesterase-related protein